MHSAFCPLHEFIPTLPSCTTFATTSTRLLTPDGTRTTLPYIAYSDDVSLPLSHKKPEQLLHDAHIAAEFATRALRSHNLKVSFKPGKSAVCLHLAGKHSKPLWQQLKNESQ
eukprot:1762673-Amphidinium_carterae.1